MKGHTKNRRLVCGVGVNDAPYSTLLGYDENGKQLRCPFYIKWKSLIARCYNPNYWEQRTAAGYLKNANYEGCTVVEEWHTFSNFKAWMEKQDWEGNQLDKDLLFPWNTVYGPDTCIFVPPRINFLLIEHKSKYMAGVQRLSNGRYWSQFRDPNHTPGQRKYIYCGTFDTELEAHKAYIKYKSQYILDMAKDVEDSRIKNALINYVKVKYGSL